MAKSRQDAGGTVVRGFGLLWWSVSHEFDVSASDDGFDFSAEVQIGSDGEGFVGDGGDAPAGGCLDADLDGAFAAVGLAEAGDFVDFFLGDVECQEAYPDACGQFVGDFFDGVEFLAEEVGGFAFAVDRAADEDDFIDFHQVSALVEGFGEHDDLAFSLQILQLEDGHFGAGVASVLGDDVADPGNHSADDDFASLLPVGELAGVDV